MKIKGIAIALALALLALESHAQTAGSTPAPGGAPGAGMRGERHLPSPEKMAEELMRKFDTDKDGELSQSELTQALESLRERRAQSAGGGATPGSTPAPGQGVTGGNRPRPAADQIAARMIEKYSSDKKGLTVAELAKAIAERRANRPQHGTPTATPAA